MSAGNLYQHFASKGRKSLNLLKTMSFFTQRGGQKANRWPLPSSIGMTPKPSPSLLVSFKGVSRFIFSPAYRTKKSQTDDPKAKRFRSLCGARLRSGFASCLGSHVRLRRGCHVRISCICKKCAPVGFHFGILLVLCVAPFICMSSFATFRIYFVCPFSMPLPFCPLSRAVRSLCCFMLTSCLCSFATTV